jgi:hypothetical protein
MLARDLLLGKHQIASRIAANDQRISLNAPALSRVLAFANDQ